MQPHYLLIMRRTIIFSIFLFSCQQAFTQNISGVVNIYRKVLWVDSANGRIKLSDVSGFGTYVGNKAMLVQMKGATMDETNTTSFGNLLSANNAGNFEVGTICGFLNDTLVFERKLNNFYDVSGKVQCVILPKYTDVTVTGTLLPMSWDSANGVGGIIALEATGTITLNADINADSSGFRGGNVYSYSGDCSDFNFPPVVYNCTEFFLANPSGNSYKSGGNKGEGIAFYISGKEFAKGKQVNGGGGGNNSNHGGAGGGNYGSGGGGGSKTGSSCVNPNPGIGGSALSSIGYSLSNFKIFMGGGGGTGHQDNDVGTPGGHGAGIVYLLCNTLQSNNQKITANGGVPYRAGLTPDPYASNSDGGGGGGAGGVIIVDAINITGNLQVEVNGGKGSNTEASAGNSNCTGPGGGGGGGLIWFKSVSLPAGVSASKSGGASGIIMNSSAACNGGANGAASGNGGNVLFNFSFPTPRDSSPICQSLVPLQMLVSLNGYVQNDKTFLTAIISNAQNLRQCILQRATAAGNFADVSSQQNNHSTQYNFVDAVVSYQTVLYRVKIISKDGGVSYSLVLRFSKKEEGKNLSVEIFPNPAREILAMQAESKLNIAATINITDKAGRILATKQQQLFAGKNTVTIVLDKLPDGILFVTIKAGTEKIVKPFVKLLH